MISKHPHAAATAAVFALAATLFAGFFIDAPGWILGPLSCALVAALAILHLPRPEPRTIVRALAAASLLAASLVTRSPVNPGCPQNYYIDEAIRFARDAAGWDYEKGWLWPAAVGAVDMARDVRAFSLSRAAPEDRGRGLTRLGTIGWMTAGLGAIAVGLTLVLGSRLAGPAAGWIGALLLAISPMAARMSHDLGPGNLLVILGPLSILAALASDRRHDAAAAGVLAGLAASIQPLFALVSAPLFVVRPSWRKALVGLAGLAAGYFAGRPSLTWPSWPPNWAATQLIGAVLPLIAIGWAWGIVKASGLLAARLGVSRGRLGQPIAIAALGTGAAVLWILVLR